MPPAADSVLVLFPGALGDFVCVLPTLRALRERHSGPMRIIARAELLDLVHLPNTTTASIDRREIADLFTSGRDILPETAQLCGRFASVYSWTGFANPEFARRVAQLGERVSVYPFRGMRAEEHAADYYARCVGLAPQLPDPTVVVQDGAWIDTFRQQHDLGDRALLVVHPGSGSAKKNWQGVTAVVRHWRAHHRDAILMLRGPAEMELQTLDGAGAVAVDGLSLPQVAALLHDSCIYLGNDSGISQLAGTVGARGVVTFGPSDPTVWSPRGGGLQVVHASAPCTACGPEQFCLHRLPAEVVIRALESRRLQS